MSARFREFNSVTIRLHPTIKAGCYEGRSFEKGWFAWILYRQLRDMYPEVDFGYAATREEAIAQAKAGINFQPASVWLHEECSTPQSYGDNDFFEEGR